MIRNSLCPYCSVSLVKAENQFNCRSVEHLIPNTVLRTKRTNDQGDFYACRKCNSRKSHIDYVLGVVTKSQSRNPDFAAETLIKAVGRDDRSSERFVSMAANAVRVGDEMHLTVPIFGSELLEYTRFLAKGQYFRKRRLIFNPGNQVILVDYANKQVHAALEVAYKQHHDSNPFRDLESNLGSEVLSDGDCIIWSKNNNYLFIFHDYTSISIRIKRRNPKNSAKEQEKNAYILENFSRKPVHCAAA